MPELPEVGALLLGVLALLVLLILLDEAPLPPTAEDRDDVKG